MMPDLRINKDHIYVSRRGMRLAEQRDWAKGYRDDGERVIKHPFLGWILYKQLVELRKREAALSS